MTIAQINLTVRYKGNFCEEACPFFSWKVHPTAYGGLRIFTCRLYGDFKTEIRRKQEHYKRHAACTAETVKEK